MVYGRVYIYVLGNCKEKENFYTIQIKYIYQYPLDNILEKNIQLIHTIIHTKYTKHNMPPSTLHNTLLQEQAARKMGLEMGA